MEKLEKLRTKGLIHDWSLHYVDYSEFPSLLFSINFNDNIYYLIIENCSNELLNDELLLEMTISNYVIDKIKKVVRGI